MRISDWSSDVCSSDLERIVVNVHYKAEIIERHLTGRPNILLSRESSLLETGGGVAKALPDLGAEPFFVVNSAAVWLRSEARRLGKECVSTCRYRWWPIH